jgi:hypothetical protein
MEQVERIAEQLRPRIEAGELRGFTDADGDAIEAADKKWRREHPRTKRVGHAYRRCPMALLTKEMTARLRLRNPHRAAVVVVASPSAPAILDPSNEHDGLWSWASDMAAWDVLRIARERGWYKPHRTEYPEPADLHYERRAA